MLENSDLVRAAVSKGVRSRAVIDAMRSVDRRFFVGTDPRSQELAYQDVPVPIGENQTTSQPSLIAAMLEALAIQPTDRALEIGTGFGYQTALLCRLCRTVVSVEHRAGLLEQAVKNLDACGIENALVCQGDGGRGMPEHAPYTVIIGSAATPSVPQPLYEQLSQGGRMILPIGPGGHEQVILYEQCDTGLAAVRTLTAARYVPMVGDYGV